MAHSHLAHAETIVPEDLSARHRRDEGIPEVIAGRYHIQKFLGAGNFGSVYRAVDERLQKTVAVKMLRRRRAGSFQAIERFRFEALAASRLSHPNIVNVTDFDVLDDGRAFLVMEFVPGETLESFLGRRAPLISHQAARLALALCDALSEAHDRWVVHRDLKPANVIVGDRDSSHMIVKILDFGIAKLVEGDATSHATAAGNLVGTPAYMAPEQIRGDAGEIDGRTDIYAVGTVLYEMLTGRTPFEAENVAALLHAQLEQVPAPPSQIRGDQPSALDRIALRALEKDPANRFETAEDMAHALRSFLSGAPVDLDADVVTRAHRPWKRLAVAAATLFAVAASPMNIDQAPGIEPVAASAPASTTPDEPLAPSIEVKPRVVQAAVPATEPAAARQQPKRRRRTVKKRRARPRHVPDAPLSKLRLDQ